MSKPVLYWAPHSQPARALKAFFVEANIPHDEKVLNILKGEHKSEEVLKVNPAGVVPFVIKDGKLLNESTAVMKLVCAKQPEKADRLYPADDFEKRYEIDKALSFAADLRLAFVPRILALFAIGKEFSEYDHQVVREQ